ncbi:FIG00554685: hypothetical protein [Cronobacter muytjensii 530]
MTLQITDIPAAIREMKQQLRQALPNYQAVFAELEADIQRQIATIQSETARGENPVPQIQADDILNSRVSEAQKARIRERGCCVIKGVFPESQARLKKKKKTRKWAITWSATISLKNSKMRQKTTISARLPTVSRKFTAFIGRSRR